MCNIDKTRKRHLPRPGLEHTNHEIKISKNINIHQYNEIRLENHGASDLI